MSAQQAAAITACTACAAVGGAAAGGAFSGESSVSLNQEENKEPDQVDSAPKKEPDTKKPWIPLATEITTTVTEYNSKLGSTYKNYFYGVFGNEQNNNQKWWEEAFQRYSSDKTPSSGAARTFSNHFSNVESAYSVYSASPTETDKSLNIVCKTAYKKQESDIKQNGTTTDEQGKLWDDIWTYCTELGHAPKKISQVNSEENDYSADSAVGKSQKEKLLSAKDTTNDILWKLKNDEFFSTNADSIEGDYFKAFRNTNPTPTDKLTLKNKCKALYNTKPDDTGTSTAPNQSQIIKYCSLDGK